MAYRRTDNVVRKLAARHEAILAAAGAIATESGMTAVQIVPVAQRAGIAAGTVYRYFPAKIDLIAALVAEHAERELGALRAAANAAPGPLSALAAGVVTFAARALSKRRFAFAVLAEPADPDIDSSRRAFREMLAKEFVGRIRAAIAGGNLPEVDAETAAAALVGALIEGLVGPLAPQANDAAAARTAVQTVTLFALRALGVVDARARGLIVQTVLPKIEHAA